MLALASLPDEVLERAEAWLTILEKVLVAPSCGPYEGTLHAITAVSSYANGLDLHQIYHSCHMTSEKPNSREAFTALVKMGEAPQA